MWSEAFDVRAVLLVERDEVCREAAEASAAVAVPVHPRSPFRRLPKPNRPCSQLPNVRSVRSAEGEPLAVLGFGAAVRKIAPQDKFIGWERRQRTFRRQQRKLLLWVRSKRLASHVLAQAMFARRLVPPLRFAFRTA